MTPNGIFIQEETFQGEDTSKSSPPEAMVSAGHFAWIAAGTTDGRIVVWNPAQEKPALVADANRSGGVTIECMIHLETKHMLVAGTGEGQLMLLSLPSPK